jgi:rubrerythrin
VTILYFFEKKPDMETKTFWSSSEWCEYLTRNSPDSDHLLTWAGDVRISHSERQAIFKSLQSFQLGESSEGSHLYRCAEKYAKATGDVQYQEAIKLFIREEQRHAQYLARFMKFAQIPLARRLFIDSVFRKLRRLAGLECSISVLIIAEIIAKIFYRALRNATASDFLHAICDRVLRDEQMHIQFQAERMAILRKSKNRIVLASTNAIHRILFAGTVLVVWMKCKKALRAGGYSFFPFFRDCWKELNCATRLMECRRYEGLQEVRAISETLENSIEPSSGLKPDRNRWL